MNYALLLSNATLDEALDFTAKYVNRSEGDVWIGPNSDGTYNVHKETMHQSDDWEWSYTNGIHDQDSVSETSRLFESNEHVETAGHIRYNLPNTVEQLEEGRCVGIGSAIVYHSYDAAFDHDEDCTDDDDCQCDRTVGWILISEHYGLPLDNN